MKGKERIQIRLWGVALALIPVGIFLYIVNLAAPLLAFLLYCCLYVAVSSARPQIGLLLLFASAPLNQDLSHGVMAHFSLAELNLALAFPVCVFQCLRQGRRVRLGPIAGWVMLYFLVCIVSSVMEWRTSALLSFFQMALYLVCAVMVFSSWLENPKDFIPIIEAAAMVGLALAVLGLASGFTFPALHKNAYGASLANILIIYVELWLSAPTPRRVRLVMIGLLVVGGGLLMTLSRGGWLGAMTGVLVLFAGRGRFGTMIKLALIMTPVIALLWVTLPQESKDYALNFQASRWNIRARIKTIHMTENMFDESPLFGTGLGVRKEIDATDLVLVTLAESGILGLVTFLGIHVAIYRMGFKTLKRLHDETGSSLVLLGLALVSARFAHGMVDEYWSRGALMQAWAGVGMATAMFYLVEPERRRTRARP